MTFRIDGISLQRPRTGGLDLLLQGFLGQGVYARAQLDSASQQLVITSTMDCTQQIAVPVLDAPSGCTHAELRSWVAEQLDRLGWGPEVDQLGQRVKPRPSHALIRPLRGSLLNSAESPT